MFGQIGIVIAKMINLVIFRSVGWLEKSRVRPSQPSIKLRLKLKLSLAIWNNDDLAMFCEHAL